MLVEHNQTQTHNPMTHKTIVNGGFEIKCLYGGDLSCQEITISHMTEGSKISCSICRPYQIEIDYGQNFNSIKHNETEENHKVSLVSFLPNLLRMSIDLLVTWGSNLAESSHHHSLANFPKVVFASNSSPLDK